MIAISKSEKQIISKKLPNAHIVRTMKQKSKRHHYYCEETKPVMRILNELRGVDQSKIKDGNMNGYKPKSRRITA